MRRTPCRRSPDLRPSGPSSPAPTATSACTCARGWRWPASRRPTKPQTAADALELARLNRYDIALVDFALAGDGGWAFVRQLRACEPAIPHLIVTKDRLSAGEKLRTWFAGQPVLLAKPPHPGKLKALLERV